MDTLNRSFQNTELMRIIRDFICFVIRIAIPFNFAVGFYDMVCCIGILLFRRKDICSVVVFCNHIFRDRREILIAFECIFPCAAGGG